jgi:CPA2 family monovalent cation:H+ antiporter-2
MVDATQTMFEFGIIMLVGFVGAAIATKAKQSVIIGYIIVGILIGPLICITIGPYTYNGLIQDTTLVSYLSTLGLTLLMFFVGLEFSFSKLKKSKSPAVILALVNTGVDMFLGLLIGLALGWPVIDTVFLAGVFAMGSAAITGKSLQEMQKMSAPETDFLLGAVVVEDFISMILLTIIGGLIFQSGSSDPVMMGATFFTIILFYVFFIFLAIFIVPRVMKHLQSNSFKNDEMFVLFALGILFLSAALAQVCGVPAIIGAFFLGMVFSESKLSERMQDRISPFKDAFVAIFFVSFGMMIDPALFGAVLPIVILAVPLVLLGDMIITSALAYFLGFTPRAAMFMGTSMCGRGAESVMFASVANDSVGVTKASSISAFAGTFCFFMSVITPSLMRASARISVLLGKVVPHSAKHSAALINRTFSKIMLPSSLKLFKRTRRLEAVLMAYFVLLIAVMCTSGWMQVMLFGAGVVMMALTYWLFESELRPIVRSINYDNLGVLSRDPRCISSFISSFIFLTLLAIMGAAFFFGVWWPSSVLILAAYCAATLVLMRRAYKVTRTPAIYSKRQPTMDWPASAPPPAERKETAPKVPRSQTSRPIARPVDVPLPRMSDDLPAARAAEPSPVRGDEDAPFRL